MNRLHRPISYDFARYLESKVPLDDRSLNQNVRTTLEKTFRASLAGDQPRIIELGAGSGTMIERLMRWQLLGNAHYTALDVNAANLKIARERITDYAVQHGININNTDQGELELDTLQGKLSLEFAARDARDLFSSDADRDRYQLIIAHAFMDLVDLEATIPALVRISSGRALLYLTLLYDGMTRFTPLVDRALDDQIEALYHQSMDERLVEYQPSGDSRTGSRLLAYLPEYGVDILNAGASDWVVYPTNRSYPGDEAYFLHHIIHTIHQELHDHPELDQARFQAWVELRHGQIELGELTYITHQLDILGRVQE